MKLGLRRVVQVAAFGFGVVLVLCIVAIIFAATLDGNKIKDHLAKFVFEKTTRQLTIAGPLKLSFWPLGLQVSDAVLSQPGNSRPFASFKDIHASVAFWPLFRRQIVVNGITLDGLRLQVDKSAAASPPANSSASSAVGSKPAASNDLPFALDISKILLTDGVIVLQNGDGELRIEALHVETGTVGYPTGKGPIEARARLISKPALAADVTIKGTYEYQLNPLAVTLTKTSISLVNQSTALPINKFSWQGDAKFNTTQAELSGSMNVQDSPGQITVRLQSFSPLAATFKVHLDGFIVPASKAKPTETAASTTAPATPSGRSASGKSNDQLFDWSLLSNKTVDGEASLNKLQMSNLTITNIKGKMNLAKNVLILSDLDASTLGGRFQGRLQGQSSDHSWRLNGNASNMQFGEALKKFANISWITGQGDLEANLASSGDTLDDLQRRLSGQGTFRLKNGTLEGIDVRGIMSEGRDLLQDPQKLLALTDPTRKTQFASLGGTFKASKGIVTNSDLDGNLGDTLRLLGNGSVNLPAKNLDYLLKVQRLDKYVLPVRVQGPWQKLSFRVEYKEALTDQLKEQLRNKAQDHIKKNLDDQLKKLLH